MKSSEARLAQIRKERLVVHAPHNYLPFGIFAGFLFVLIGHSLASNAVSRIDFNILSKNFDYGTLWFFAGLGCIFLGVNTFVSHIYRFINYGPAAILDSEGIYLNSGYLYFCEVSWDGIAEVKTKVMFKSGRLFRRTHRCIELRLHNPRALIDPLTFWERVYVQFPIPRNEFPIYITEDAVDENLDWLAAQIRRRLGDAVGENLNPDHALVS